MAMAIASPSLGALILICVLLAAGVVVWFFQSVQDNEQDRAVLVVQVAASSWAQCYSYTELSTGTVQARALEECGG
ncbi:hypothetical protein [Streptomyces hokutonensis]|uniref:Uncharacterized protein n=1 Tax=Streptomyces hokutonensis TaxID=1306990 RepID=A0ABW6MKR3_9ACTN